MHFWGWKQKMGSLNKLSAFPVLRCWTAPAHPPLPQTNPSLERATHPPSSVASQTWQCTYKQPGSGPCQGQLGTGRTLSAVQVPRQVRKANSGHDFSMQNSGLNSSLKPVPSQHVPSLPSSCTKCLQRLFHEPDHTSDPALKPNQNPEIRKSFLSFPRHSSSWHIRGKYRWRCRGVRWGWGWASLGTDTTSESSYWMRGTPQREMFGLERSLPTSHLIMKEAFPPCLPTTSPTVPFHVTLSRNTVWRRSASTHLVVYPEGFPLAS